MKRRRSVVGDRDRCKPKQQRIGSPRDLFEFSDEILLKVLGYLTVRELTVAER